MHFRLTTKRKRILETLKQQQEMITAAELHRMLPDLDLVTIYRNLELFTQERLIKRVQLRTNEAYYEYQHEPHHHAICRECDRVVHFTAADTKIKKLLQLDDFKIDDIEVTVRGTCNH